MVAQQLVDTAPGQEEPQCYLVTIEVDYEQPEFIKGFGSQADAEEFREALETYQRSKPSWPDAQVSQDEWARVEKARETWMDEHPGGRAAIGAERFGIIPVPYVASQDQPPLTDVSAVMADHARLVRELDVLLNGEAGAAKQASLCDIVAQLRTWLGNPVTAKSLIKKRRQRTAQSPAPVGAGSQSVDIANEVVILETKDSKGADLWISDWDGVFMLDSSSTRMGFKVYDTLPRAYRTERGARQAAALLTEEKLKWSNVGEDRER